MALDPITGIADLANTIGGIVSKFIPDKTAQAQASAEIQLELIKQIGSGDQAQSTTNTAEATSDGLFKGGWRPMVGWVCAAAFAWQFVGQPALSFAWVLWTHNPAPVMTLDTSELMTVLLGMLGLGGMRTYEKLQGVNK